MLRVRDASLVVDTPKQGLPENIAYIKRVTFMDVAHLVSDEDEREDMRGASEIYAIYNQHNCIVGLCPGYDSAVERSIENGFLRPYLLQ